MPHSSEQFLPDPQDLAVLLPPPEDEQFADATPTQFRHLAGEMLRTGLEQNERSRFTFPAIEWNNGLVIDFWRTYEVNWNQFDLGDPLRIFDDRFVIDIDRPEVYQSMTTGQRLMLMSMMVLRPRFFRPFREIMTRLFGSGLVPGSMRGGVTREDRMAVLFQDTVLTGMTVMTSAFYAYSAGRLALTGSPWGLLIDFALSLGSSVWTISQEVADQQRSDARLQQLGNRDVAVAECVALLRAVGLDVSGSGALTDAPAAEEYVRNTIGPNSPWQRAYLPMLERGMAQFLGELIERYTTDENKITVAEGVRLVAADVAGMFSRITRTLQADLDLLLRVSAAEAEVLSNQYLAGTIPLLLAPPHTTGFASLLYAGIACPERERAITLQGPILPRTSLGGRVRAQVQLHLRSIWLRIFQQVSDKLKPGTFAQFREVFVKTFEWGARLINVSLRTLGLDKFIGLNFNRDAQVILGHWYSFGFRYPVVRDSHVVDVRLDEELGIPPFLDQDPQLWLGIAHLVSARFGHDFGPLGLTPAKGSIGPALVGGVALGASLIYLIPKVLRFGK